ncbi:MAG TPA: HYR domain-containing protein [Nocardioides sp.]|nr:HYR domain-containing protein [Nocardioides sp.]
MRVPPPSALARVVPVGVLSLALGAAATVAATGAPGVSPQHYADELAPGASVTITKTVETPPIPPNPDIVFLADTTTSMNPSIANVQANATGIVSQILAAQPTARFAVADYKDTDDPSHFLVRQQLTADSSDVIAGIGAWTPTSGGGSDAAEDWIGALGAIPGAIDFRADGTPIVVMFGDSTSHDPSAGFTLGSATAALEAAGVRVIAIAVPSTDEYLWDGLDSEGQASYVTSHTGGTLTNADPGQVSDVILSQLQNLPAEVTHEVTCDAGVSATLTPTSPTTVTSGGTVTFDETITLTGDAPQGQTVSCTVSFEVNGEVPGPEFVQTVDIDVADVTPPVVTVESKVVEATGPDGAVVAYDAGAVDNVDGPLTPTCTPPSGSQFPLGVTPVACEATDAAGNTGHGAGTIEVVDTTPPTVACTESTNPGGKLPPAGGTRPNPQGQNQDGFYRLDATDVVDADPEVYLRDTGSGHVWGPFASGQRIKYTEAASGPSQGTLGASDVLHLTGTGDAELYAVDFSGNAASPVACLVPAPPK